MTYTKSRIKFNTFHTFNNVTTIEQELIKTGYRYSDNEDGSFDVCYDHNQDAFFSPLNGYHVATVKEDDEHWYVDNGCGAGWGEYSKEDWTLERAIYDQCIDELFQPSTSRLSYHCKCL